MVSLPSAACWKTVPMMKTGVMRLAVIQSSTLQFTEEPTFVSSQGSMTMTCHSLVSPFRESSSAALRPSLSMGSKTTGVTGSVWIGAEGSVVTLESMETLPV